MPVRDVNNATYHYTDQGSGQPVILLHGFMGSILNWDTITPILERHNRVIAIDILGHGRSASPANFRRYSIEETASDIAALLETLNAKSINLVGYSMGARVALYFALANPHFMNKLVLESGSPGLETQIEQSSRIASDHQLARWLLENGMAAFVERWEQLPLFASQARLPAEAQAKQKAQRLQNDPIGLANSLRGMGTGSQPSLWEKLNKLTAPTLLIAGDLDPKYCAIAARLAQILPQATLQIVPDAGHNVHLEKQKAYLQLVQNFLKG